MGLLRVRLERLLVLLEDVLLVGLSVRGVVGLAGMHTGVAVEFDVDDVQALAVQVVDRRVHRQLPLLLDLLAIFLISVLLLIEMAFERL